MSLATSLNPFLNIQLVGPAVEGTQPLIVTHPSTPLPGDPADTDLMSPLSSVPADLNASPNDEKLYSSTEVEQLWNRVLQTNLTEDNGGLHASDYPSSKLSAHPISNSPLAHVHGSLSSLVTSEGHTLQM
jgi:hypothetical protein